MEFFSPLMGIGNTLFTLVLPFLFVLTVVVFFHELGHFAVARWCGVKVSAFSIGFGPEIFGFVDKKGTRWRFAWIPLGGYVKFIDDEKAASVSGGEKLQQLTFEEREGSFHEKSLAQRTAVVAAGPIANFILAIVIFAFMFTFIGERITAPIVDEISPDSAAMNAGFKPGDRITSIDGSVIESFSDLQRIVSVSAERTLSIDILRDGRELTLLAVPKKKEIKDRFGNKIKLGVLGIRRNTSPDSLVLTKHDPLTSIWKGTKETYFIIDRTMSYLYGVIMGRESAEQLGGPIRIAQVSSQVASIGFLALMNLVAILSVSIGLINLFPIPMLDGGHLMYYAIEALKGEPVSDRAREIGFRIGLALVLMLMVFATWNDLVQLGAS